MKNGGMIMRFHLKLNGEPLLLPATIAVITSFAADVATVSYAPPVGRVGARSPMLLAISTRSRSRYELFPIEVLQIFRCFSQQRDWVGDEGSHPYRTTVN